MDLGLQMEIELVFRWQGVDGCLCGVGPHDFVSVTGGRSGRLKRVERKGRSSVPLGLGGGSEDGQEGSDGERLGGGPLGFGGLSAEA